MIFTLYLFFLTVKSSVIDINLTLDPNNNSKYYNYYLLLITYY